MEAIPVKDTLFDVAEAPTMEDEIAREEAEFVARVAEMERMSGTR